MTAVVADTITETLASAGISRVFCVPGVHIDELCRSISANPDIELIVCRTEHGSGMMAIGHARASGQVGCCLTIPGPGLLNLATVLATAAAASVPLLCLSGAIVHRWNGAGLGLLHEAPPIMHHDGLLSAWHTLAARDSVAREVHALLAATLCPPHRPALLEVPVDVGALRRQEQPPHAHLDPSPSETVSLTDARNLLTRSTQPLVVSGGGVRAIGSVVLDLAAKLHAPVVPTINGRTATLETDSRVLPPTALGSLWEACDVVIAAGTRLASIYGNDRYRTNPRPVIRIDADAHRHKIHEAPSVSLLGDAAEIIPALTNDQADTRRSTWNTNALTTLRNDCNRARDAVQPQAEYTDAFHHSLDGRAILALDSTQIAYHIMYALPLAPGRDLLTAGRHGALGSALAMALGAKLAAPDRQVVCVIGDGGLIFGLAELATMAKERLGVAVVVFNDNAYGEVMLSSPYKDAVAYGQLLNPDFVALANSFGVSSRRACTPGELGEALHHDLMSGMPSLIEVPISPCPKLGRIFNVGPYGSTP